MRVFVNGEARLTGARTLAALLEEQGFGVAVATAVNEVFIAKVARLETEIQEGDRVEVLAAMQGG
ncbi:sulfur carrier protein ThiS [Rhodobacter sp. 24-YEA-8]|uniref:sulfur carrier protein ThiS n=1 Tax=Rhodobacter sp. 24-YEA-8 TaxID=1884310 RepID=UPI00089A94A3|nr:sulfur carrier protein ThiS [Rhodobacter sp. 24-YEA-8]SEB62763.1 sulfur carrier protein [Rhodobacter sp. 24-YEA-8]